jgi:regulatory protein
MSEEDLAGDGEGGDALAGEAYAKALELLASRAHFAAELAVKLQRRGFARPAIERAMARLTGDGYLDDLAAAQSFARQRTRHRGWGPARLRAELGRRRVDAAIVRQVVAEVFAYGELVAARDAAEGWLAKGGGDRDRLARYLDRRGFSRGTIVEILRRIEPGDPSAHEEL